MDDSPGRVSTPASAKLARVLPDLLNAQPQVVLDHAEVRKALCIAFSTGDAEQSLERVMDRARMCDSSWRGSSFRQGLYMHDLLTRCMPIHVEGLEPKANLEYLLRLLENPPRDPASLEFRRAITAELVADPERREAFEQTYAELHQLRTELQALDNVGYYDSRVRRLFTLSLLRDLFVALKDRFAESNSGLARISNFARHVTQTPAFSALDDLLQYEDGMSEVQFKMRVGSDGTLRRFDVLQIQENKDNRYYQNPVRRLFSKFALWWRGYRIGESGLLDAWLEDVFGGMSAYMPPLLRLMGEQELYLAGLGFRDQCDARGLATSFPIMTPAQTGTDDAYVDGLFNPLLFTVGVVPVPCRVDGAALCRKTILTGPNSGGKTRLLQSLGITQVLAESGLYAPVRAARLPRANGLFVSLIEEGAVDQSEGRLGMELLRIRKLFERAQVGSLVVLDELCSGTNPSEGEEIFLLVLSLLEELDARAVVATHFLDFARGLKVESGTTSFPLRLAFLQVDARGEAGPTYQFCEGVARTSMAQETARRLGVTDSVLRSLVHRQRQAAGITQTTARSVSLAAAV